MSIYDEFPARRVLSRTFRDSADLPAAYDSERTARVILALAGGTNTEDARRCLDVECARAATILSSVERERVRRFDAAVGIGFGSPLFPCRLDDPASKSGSLAHVGCSFFMRPDEARALADDLIAAADKAEGKVTP